MRDVLRELEVSEGIKADIETLPSNKSLLVGWMHMLGSFSKAFRVVWQRHAVPQAAPKREWITQLVCEKIHTHAEARKVLCPVEETGQAREMPHSILPLADLLGPSANRQAVSSSDCLACFVMQHSIDGTREAVARLPTQELGLARHEHILSLVANSTKLTCKHEFAKWLADKAQYIVDL